MTQLTNDAHRHIGVMPAYPFYGGAPVNPDMSARVALVSGSSRGLGVAIARRLARDGLVVAVNGLHDDDELTAVVRAIQADGGVAEPFIADVTDDHRNT